MQCYSTSTMDNKKCFSEVLSCPAPTGVRELTKGEELDLYRKHQSATIVQHLLSQRIWKIFNMQCQQDHSATNEWELLDYSTRVGPSAWKALQWWGRRAQAHPPGTHTVPTLLPVVTLAVLRTPQQHQHHLKACTETLSALTCTHLTAEGELWAWQMLALLICRSWKHSERRKGSSKSTLTGRQWCPWCCIILLLTHRYTKAQLTIRHFWITALWFMEELCGMVHPRAPRWA